MKGDRSPPPIREAVLDLTSRTDDWIARPDLAAARVQTRAQERERRRARERESAVEAVETEEAGNKAQARADAGKGATSAVALRAFAASSPRVGDIRSVKARAPARDVVASSPALFYWSGGNTTRLAMTVLDGSEVDELNNADLTTTVLDRLRLESPQSSYMNPTNHLKLGETKSAIPLRKGYEYYDPLYKSIGGTIHESTLRLGPFPASSKEDREEDNQPSSKSMTIPTPSGSEARTRWARTSRRGRQRMSASTTPFRTRRPRKKPRAPCSKWCR